MDNLETLVKAVAKAIAENRKHATICVKIRPGHVVKNKSPIYATAIRYVLDVLAHNSFAKKYVRSRRMHYLICRDSELYGMGEEELARKIVEIVERYEKEEK